MADNGRPWTCSSIGAATGNQPAQKKVTRSGGLTTNININSTKPPNNTNKKSKFSIDPSKTPVLTSNSPKGQFNCLNLFFKISILKKYFYFAIKQVHL